MIPQKNEIKNLALPGTKNLFEKSIINPKKEALSFKFMKTQGMSGGQDQKERKTASTVTTTFFGQKISTAQVRFCNDCEPSRNDEWSNNELIKMT